jgi:hypothetical protein
MISYLKKYIPVELAFISNVGGDSNAHDNFGLKMLQHIILWGTIYLKKFQITYLLRHKNKI